MTDSIQKYFREDVLQMRPYVPGEQSVTGKVIKLNTNENPYPPSPTVSTAIAAASAHRLERYPDPLGTSFRMVAADLFGLTPDHFLCGNGSDDILTILTRAFVPMGGILRMPTPSYVLYRTLADIQGARVEEIRFADDFSLSADFTSTRTAPSLAFLPNPNSPSGTLVGRDEIIRIANALPCPLIVDEAYVDFADHTCVDLVDQYPNILVTRTLSKSYGLAGLRFGYLVAAPPMIAQLRKIKDSYNCDALSIAGATAALSDQKWLAENVARIRSTRARMETDLRAMGFDITPSQANFVWCTHPDWPLAEIHQRLKSCGVLVRYMNYPDWGDGLRISVGTDPEADAVLSVLKSLV
jgi:histidinol-phosphate aminotransferase